MTIKLPEHKCALYLVHNEHKNLYQSLEEWLSETNDMYEWENEEARARAIATDECWTLQWYKETPIGFHAIAAPTLEELLVSFTLPDVLTG
jgi:hypothetical protein